MNDNLFEEIIGRRVLKWDAVWRVINWLADPTKGHGLNHGFRDQFVGFCLNGRRDVAELRVEYYLGKDANNRSRHPDMAIASPSLDAPQCIALIDDLASISPNNSRKIDNLLRYAQICSDNHQSAERSIVVITDTNDIARFDRLIGKFSNLDHTRLALLPLQDIGSWLSKCNVHGEPRVREFSEWCVSL